MFVNNMWSGSKHESTRVPLLSLGGLNGTLQTGRVMEYGDRPENERKLCSFYLSLMNRMGVASRVWRFATRVDRLVAAHRLICDEPLP